MKLISVIGASQPKEEDILLAFEVGKLIAEFGFVLVCGGLGGLMEAACKGAKSNNGLTIGIIPTTNKEDANPYVDIPILTGMGYARNVMVAYSGDLVIALPGKYGTLTEIGFALSIGKRVIGINTWEIDGIEKIESVSLLKPILAELV